MNIFSFCPSFNWITVRFYPAPAIFRCFIRVLVKKVPDSNSRDKETLFHRWFIVSEIAHIRSSETPKPFGTDLEKLIWDSASFDSLDRLFLDVLDSSKMLRITEWGVITDMTTTEEDFEQVGKERCGTHPLVQIRHWLLNFYFRLTMFFLANLWFQHFWTTCSISWKQLLFFRLL